MAMVKKSQLNESLKCEYCGKQYQVESAFLKHTCKQKQRHDARGSKAVALGLHAFNYFYKRFLGGTQNQTVEKFEKSSYYNAFVKFGIYCTSSKVIAPEKYAEWLVENKIRIDSWASDKHYEKFLIEYLQTEPIVDALERAIKFSMTWAEEKNMRPQDILRYGGSMRIVHAIASGALSPWVLYLSESGVKFLESHDGWFLDATWVYIDSEQWQKIISSRRADAEYVISILKLAGW